MYKYFLDKLIRPCGDTAGLFHYEMDRGSEAAGVKRIRVHDLRHSHVSYLIDKGFTAFDLPEYDADIITLYKPLADLFEETVDPDQVSVTAENLSKLIKMIEDSTTNRGAAKEVFEAMFKDNVDPEKYVEEHNMKQDNDEEGLKGIIKKVIEENPKAADDVRNGKEKAIGALVGQTMKATQGKANPGLVNKLIKELL